MKRRRRLVVLKALQYRTVDDNLQNKNMASHITSCAVLRGFCTRSYLVVGEFATDNAEGVVDVVVVDVDLAEAL